MACRKLEMEQFGIQQIEVCKITSENSGREKELSELS